MEALRLFSLLLALCVGTQRGEAAECMPDSKYLCTARCNGTSFDLSKAFDFPINITEPTARSSGPPWWYLWDPCHNVECPGAQGGKDCAICQKADGSFYNCGQITKPIWLMDDWPAPDSGEDWPNWQVEFTFGSTWRISIFKFIVDHKVEKPVVKFISEDPVVQYNFEVRGKCIGQESFDCQKYYKLRSNK